MKLLLVQERNLSLSIVALAIFVYFPMSILPEYGGGSTAYILISFIGLVGRYWKQNQIEFNKEEKRIIYSFVIFYLFTVLNYLIPVITKGSVYPVGHHTLDRNMRLVLLIPFLYALLQVKNLEKVFWYSLSLASYLFGILVIIINITNIKVSNDHFFTIHHIALGMYAVSILTGLVFGYQRIVQQTALPKWVLNLGIILLVCSIVVVKARSAWLMIPIPLLIFLLHPHSRFPRRLKITALAVITAAAVLLYVIPTTGVKARMDLAFSDVDMYFDKGKSDTSLGHRFEMWRAGTSMFKEAPILGLGTGGYIAEVKRVTEQYHINKHITVYVSPHNEYVNVLATRGIVGFVLLLVMFIAPLIYFNRVFSEGNDNQRTFAFIGLSHVAISALSATANDFLESNNTSAFYVVMIGICMALIMRYRTQEGNDRS